MFFKRLNGKCQLGKRICIVLSLGLVVLLTVILQDRILQTSEKGTKTYNRSSQNSIPVQVSVDPRVELMSIVFRLAGNPEYNKGCVVSYLNDIEKHFGPYRNHPAVQTASDLTKTRGVSYDAPMSLAIHITDTNSLNERVPFDPHPVGLDGRWQLDEVRDFLAKLRQFAKESDFEDFIRAHQALYNKTIIVHPDNA
jgi:hypothetical protein